MRKVLIILILITINSFRCFGQDLYYKVIEDSTLYEYPERINSDNVIGEISKGSKVLLFRKFIDKYVQSLENKEFFYAPIIFNNKKYYISCSAIAPWDSKVILPENILHTEKNTHNKSWVMSYYLDILQSQNHEKLFTYEPFWGNSENPYFLDEIFVDYYPWNKLFDSKFGTFYITNSNIRIGYADIAITNIKQEKINKVLLSCSSLEEKSRLGDNFGLTLDWSMVQNENDFDLIFISDGEYIDIYLENESNLICTITQVDNVFIEQFNELIKTNKSDLNSVTWPTRADGSMDYPVQSELLLINFTPTHKTNKVTKLYANSSFHSEAITELFTDVPLRYLSKENQEWIKVLTKNGFEGWCVSDNLTNILDFPVLKSINVPVLPEPIIEEPKVEEPSVEDIIALERKPKKTGFYLSPANRKYLIYLLVFIFLIIIFIKLIKMFNKRRPNNK